MKRFILTLQFLTRIPIPVQLQVTEEDFAKGVVYFPIVGLIIGLLNGAVYYAASVFLPGAFSIACYLLANTAITGALHIDGLADTCDGLFSSRTKERMLEIMKDSRIGTNGVIAIAFEFLFRFVLLSILPFQIALLAVILSPVAGRTFIGILMYISTYARKEGGLGGLYVQKVTSGRIILSSLSGLAMLMIGMDVKGLLLFTACLGITLLYKRFVYSKIQGMTGDTLGAGNEIIEISYIFMVALLQRAGVL